MEIMGTANFVSGTLEGVKRLGGCVLASIVELLAVRLALARSIGLATEHGGVAFTRDIGGELTDIGVKRAEAGVARVVGSLVGHTESEDYLPDLPLMDKSPQLRAELQLGNIKDVMKDIIYYRESLPRCWPVCQGTLSVPWGSGSA